MRFDLAFRATKLNSDMVNACFLSEAPVVLCMSFAPYPPGDWTQYWTARLPVKSIFIGKAKGRSIKAIRSRVSDLRSSQETRSQSILLQEYLSVCEAAHELRTPHKVLAMDADDLSAKLSLVLPHITVPPPDLAQALLHRRKKELMAKQQYREFTLCLLPWAPVENASNKFEMLRPVMHTLPRNEPWRMAVFMRVFIEEGLCSLVFEGESGAEATKLFVGAALQVFDEQDPLEMSDLAVQNLSDCQLSLRATKSLLHLEATVAALDDIKETERAANQTKACAQPNYGGQQ